MNWNIHVKTERPTIYADMNIFRYLACGDISITNPERFIWVYSCVHVSEIFQSKSKNRDALKGMKMLNAVEIFCRESKGLPTDSPMLRRHTNIFSWYEEREKGLLNHRKDEDDYAYGPISYLLGADNYEEIKRITEKIYEEIVSLEKMHEELACSESITKHKEREGLIAEKKAAFKERVALIEATRIDRVERSKILNKKLLTNDELKKIREADLPIDALLETWEPSKIDTNKDQFLRYISGDDYKSIKVTQGWAIHYLYSFLNMNRIFPDKGLTKSELEKIKNIINDSEHTEMASYCDALISADKRLCSKARSIYTFIENTTEVLHFEYQEGRTFNIKIESDGTLELISSDQ